MILFHMPVCGRDLRGGPNSGATALTLRRRQGYLKADPFLRPLCFSAGRAGIISRKGGVSMSRKRLLALEGVALIVLGTVSAVAVGSGPSARRSVPWEGAGTAVRALSSGIGEVESGTTGPYVAYTLVLFNNTLIPGNFLAWNGLQPVAVAYDSGKGELFVTNSNSVSVISDATNAVVASIPVGSGAVAYASGNGERLVSDTGSDSGSVISDATDAVVASIPEGGGPGGGA